MDYSCITRLVSLASEEFSRTQPLRYGEIIGQEYGGFFRFYAYLEGEYTFTCAWVTGQLF